MTESCILEHPNKYLKVLYVYKINMIRVVILDMLGRKKEGRIDDKTSLKKQMKNILKNKGTGIAQELGSWTYNNNEVKIYGWEDGKAGKENKHEIPPPYDTNLYFGDVLVVHSSRNNLINFTKKTYDEFFKEMYGGFEDIGSTDSESEGSESEDSESEGSDTEDSESEESVSEGSDTDSY
jgi:hypothetical protein